MSKCGYTDNGKVKVLNFLYNDSTTNSSNYIIDETKINKLNDLFTIKTLDAELDKNAPINVGENGIISNINLGSKGRYYNNEAPKIIIKSPASPDGKQAKATAVMDKKTEGVSPNANEYWEISNIRIDDGGSGYDAVKDIDKIEIERKNTAQKKIIYNEAKPNYYLLEKKESQCNNLTDRWHNWFTIPYYYLGNNDGRRKIDESDKTRRVFQCYNKCADEYVVNNDSGANICESIETFNDGKYEKYISYDPLAIICILGSKLESNVIYQGVPGNYYHTIQNIKSADVDVDINTEVRDKILASLGNKKYRNNNNNPVVIIKADIDKAYDKLVEYIESIIKEAEKDDSKIKKKIKDDIGKFYMLFDTRDKLYISYLDKLKAAIPFKRVLYAKSIAHTQSKIPNKNDTDTHTYLNYLFKYCKFLYFDENNIFAKRLLNYGIYDTDYITIINNPDEEDELAKTTKHIPMPINYNPVTVKIDTKHKNIFDDYSNAYELYKSFILTYPIILLLSVGLCIIIMFAYWSNIIYYTASFLNSLYIFVIGVLYFFIVLLVCNSVVIRMVVFIISTTYKVANFIYNTIIDAFSYTIVRIILFFILITALANNDLSSFVYAIIMYILNTIIYFTMGIISIFLYIIYGFIYLKSEVIIPSLIILSIMYLYYKIWFNFDINTLDKEMKKNTKIINEHSNITTILKSDAGATISTARFELYKHSYFSNLYEKALDNYKEKIEEIEKYQKNKELSNNNSSDNEKAKEKEIEKENRSVLTNKNKELQDKIDNAEIAREQRKSVQTEIRDLKIDEKDDKKLKEINDELNEDSFKKFLKKRGNIPEDKITLKSDEELSQLNTKKEQLLSEFKEKREKLLKDKAPLLDKLNTLKKKEAAARNDINTNNISKTANNGIDAALSSVKGLNNFADINKGKAINKLFNLTK